MLKSAPSVLLPALVLVGCAAPAPDEEREPAAGDTTAAIVGAQPLRGGTDEALRGDDQIRGDLRARLDGAGLGGVTVEVVDGDVYLRGWVDTPPERSEAAEVAAGVDGVGSVYAGEILTR